MKYLLDTNICILLIRQKSQAVLQRLTQLPLTDVAVSAITVAELRYGVAKSRYVAQNQQALDYFLLPLTILPFERKRNEPYFISGEKGCQGTISSRIRHARNEDEEGTARSPSLEPLLSGRDSFRLSDAFLCEKAESRCYNPSMDC